MIKQIVYKTKNNDLAILCSSQSISPNNCKKIILENKISEDFQDCENSCPITDIFNYFNELGYDISTLKSNSHCLVEGIPQNYETSLKYVLEIPNSESDF